ncbi:3'(2'),5'-bisphosphate nucleotidase CysQ [Croceicoccus ponticola]|uniref:3'(2'),5'-bisphosphate nucleotidase CysQ n=1 Tax=Croceicoccus ponticola TaxID=2217664 RepID=A0A437GZA9_9SPHN|nr:3'(2'),5'-bisphosphate nucleotidase CysQ [Croceicoccus ponticola]RVQ68688.1 3'(2'),5'-bisphosphate nucleotidase CysQ [Croceicoccus ponticola]
MSAIIESDAELAAILADTAGKIAVAVRDSGLIDGKALGDAGDKVVNAFLMRAIAAQRPDDGVLSEESADTPERLGKERVWIIDPVDGTREYGERRSDWAVHVGLAIGGKPVIGAVALPGVPQVLRSDQVSALPPVPATLRMVVSRTRPGADSKAVAEAIGAELVPMGSAGAKAMAVIRGEADIYLHSGGQYEWDNCAPAAVALAHGLHASRIDGSPLVYNQKDVSLPDLLICRKEHAERVLKLVAEIG